MVLCMIDGRTIASDCEGTVKAANVPNKKGITQKNGKYSDLERKPQSSLISRQDIAWIQADLSAEQTLLLARSVMDTCKAASPTPRLLKKRKHAEAVPSFWDGQFPAAPIPLGKETLEGVEMYGTTCGRANWRLFLFPLQ
eukprot:1608186-Amphidinium_carterae.1